MQRKSAQNVCGDVQKSTQNTIHEHNRIYQFGALKINVHTLQSHPHVCCMFIMCVRRFDVRFVLSVRLVECFRGEIGEIGEIVSYFTCTKVFFIFIPYNNFRIYHVALIIRSLSPELAFCTTIIFLFSSYHVHMKSYKLVYFMVSRCVHVASMLRR